MNSDIAYLWAILSAVFNGSFAMFFKLEKVASLNLHPILFTLYVSFGVFLSSWIAIPLLPYNTNVLGDDEAGTTFQFSYLGIIAGGILVIAFAFSFLAVQSIGVALAQGIWGGCAIFISYIWGVIIFQETPKSPVGSAFGVIILILGVSIIAANKSLTQRFFGITQSETQPFAKDFNLTEEFNPPSSDSEETSPKPTNLFTGVLFAFLVGLSGGSILAPMHFVPLSQSGLAFLPSFGIGAMIFSPIVAVIWFVFVEPKKEEGQEANKNNSINLPPLHLVETLPVGILSGFFWNISNAFAIAAIPQLGYGVAYPILQCALFVAGIWGVFLFKEIRSYEIIVFFIGGIVLIGGAVLIAVSAG